MNLKICCFRSHLLWENITNVGSKHINWQDWWSNTYYQYIDFKLFRNWKNM